VQNSLNSTAYSYQRQSNPRNIGLVFSMTDSLSEDDDEKHHPVSLLNSSIDSCTPVTEREKVISSPGYGYLPARSDPLQRANPGTLKTKSSIFQNRCSYGLIRL
jgi:hypothetical protein